MAWTATTDRITGYTVTAADWNIVEDNLTFLFGDSGWTNISPFTGTWAAGTFQPRYILIGRVVYLEGQITGGTINTAAFTLPAGYRPSQSLALPTVANNAAAQLTVATTGICTPVWGATTVVSISCNFSTV